jgi:hypothetical protein
VDPSSLVFLAIIGVWAAYLVPTWVRRRVHLAQSRSRDRFSAGARVLSRRRSPAGSSHRSTSAVLSPAVPGAVPAAEPGVVPGVGTGAAPGVAPPAEPVSDAARVSRVGEADRARARTVEREAHIAHAGVVERARLAAARRARVMVALVLFSVAAWAVALATASPIWVSVPPSVMLVVHLLAGRLAAVRSRRTLATSRARLVAARRRAEAAVAATSAAVVEPEVAAVADDVEEAPAAVVGGDSWTPIPVPPPTYTLKPMVPRPEPAPLPDATPAPAARTGRGALPRRPEEIERILDLDDVEPRRAVNG